MTDPVPPPLPPFVFGILFEGAPITVRPDFEGCREYLADVIEEHAELYQVWALDTAGEASQDRTGAFVDDWAKCFEFAGGDEPDEFLAPYPAFIRAFIGDKLIADYRAAQEAA